MGSPLLTPEKAAELLAISTRQLRTLTNAGLIRYVNVGRGVKLESRRYHPADIEAYVEANRCLSSSAQALSIIPTTSNCGVLDFTARRAARRSQRQSDAKRN